MNRTSEEVQRLWLEMRETMQYPLLWDRVEENVALVKMRENKGALPTQDDLMAVLMPTSRGGSPAYWMQQVDVPAWFRRDELGMGTSVNYFDTQRTLKQTNARRAAQHRRQLERLETARKVLSRTYRT